MEGNFSALIRTQVKLKIVLKHNIEKEGTGGSTRTPKVSHSYCPEGSINVFEHPVKTQMFFLKR